MRRVVRRTTLAFVLITACDRSDDQPAKAAAEPEPVAAAPAAPVAAQIAPPGPPQEPMPHGFAILKPGATVHLTANDTVPAAVLPSIGPGVAVAAIGREGEYVVFETLVDYGPHCAAGVSAVGGLRLRWLAAPADLLPLTSRRAVVDYSDGTRTELLAGVPLRKEDDAWIATDDGVEIFVRLPDDAIDRYYSLGDRTFPDAEREPLAKGDEPLIYDRTRALAEDRLQSTFFDQRRVATFARTEKDGRTLGEVRTHCAAMRVIVPSSRTVADAAEAASRLALIGAMGSTGMLMALGSTGEHAPTWFVDAGATVYWRDGSIGGLVEWKQTFDTKPETVGTRTCFAVKLDESEASRIDLCFDPAIVQETVGASPGELDHAPGVFGLGGLGGELGGGGLIGGGIIGSAGSSGGSGLGTIGGTKAPRVTTAKPTVTGALDKDIIRRIVRAHINEVRYCYNKGLTKDPTLAGKVGIVFTINGSGDVSTSKVRDDTVPDASVGVCIAKAVKRWKFPKPLGGGGVVVEYPFVLAPA